MIVFMRYSLCIVNISVVMDCSMHYPGHVQVSKGCPHFRSGFQYYKHTLRHFKVSLNTGVSSFMYMYNNNKYNILYIIYIISMQQS